MFITSSTLNQLKLVGAKNMNRILNNKLND